jgi:hypothetical protein
MKQTTMQILISEFTDIKWTEIIKRASELLEDEKQNLIDFHKDGQRFILNDSDEKIIEHASIEFFELKYGS